MRVLKLLSLTVYSPPGPLEGGGWRWSRGGLRNSQGRFTPPDFRLRLPFRLSLILGTSLLFLTCSGIEEGEAITEAVIQEKFRERVAALSANVRRDCDAEILLQARQRADSLLLDRARRRKRLAGRPPRPRRPGAPPVRELSAPLPLRPLFPFEVRFDTLLRDSLLRDSLLQDSLLRFEEELENG